MGTTEMICQSCQTEIDESDWFHFGPNLCDRCQAKMWDELEVRFEILTKPFLADRITDFIKLDQECFEQAWGEEQFSFDFPGKWELSRCAMIANDIVGYVIASRKGEVQYVHRLAVSQWERKKGIGKGLLETLHGRVWLIAINRDARQFYEKIGFRSIEETSRGTYMERTCE